MLSRTLANANEQRFPEAVRFTRRRQPFPRALSRATTPHGGQSYGKNSLQFSYDGRGCLAVLEQVPP
jgi:hypothetical protein